MKYQYKERDIDVFVDGVYRTTVTKYKTLKEAKEGYSVQYRIALERIVCKYPKG